MPAGGCPGPQVPQCCSIAGGPAGWTLTLTLTLDGAAAAALDAERSRRRQGLLDVIRRRVAEAPEFKTWQATARQAEDAARERRRLARDLDAVPDRRADLLADRDAAGTAVAAKLAALAKQEPALRSQLADLDAGIADLLRERDRCWAALQKAAAAAASAARLEALAAVAETEGTLAGLPDAAGGALDEVALALLHGADTEALLFRPGSVAEQVTRTLAAAGG
jgi:hypothetical protein